MNNTTVRFRGIALAMGVLLALSALNTPMACSQDKPTARPAASRLVTGIAKANKLLGRMSEFDRRVIDEAGDLKGEFQLAPTISSFSRDGDETIKLNGVVMVNMGEPERFRTRQERDEIGALTKALLKEQQELKLNLSQFKGEWQRRYPAVSRKAMVRSHLPGWYSRKHGGHITDADYEARIARMTREGKALIDEAQQALDAAARPVNERTAALDIEAETVRVAMTIPAPLARQINAAALAKAAKPSMHGTITNYDAATLAEDAGSMMHIGSVEMLITDVHKSLRRDTAPKPGPAQAGD